MFKTCVSFVHGQGASLWKAVCFYTAFFLFIYRAGQNLFFKQLCTRFMRNVFPVQNRFFSGEAGFFSTISTDPLTNKAIQINKGLVI